MRKIYPILLIAFAFSIAHSQAVGKRNVVHKPNLEIYVYRRSYTSDEKVSVRLSAFNVQHVQFRVLRLDLATVVQTSRDIEDFGKRLRAMKLDDLPAVKSWMLNIGTTYPDQWIEREVKVPTMRSGTYVVCASAGGVQKRTWLAVTDIALVAKRSRQELLVFAAQARSGRPVEGLPLTLADEHGRRETGRSDAEGVWRTRSGGEKGSGNLWVYGVGHESPAFLLVGTPPPPEPYAAYMVTDRPIYRPSQKVLLRGSVRQRLEADTPGGFVYRPYANRAATLEIRDSTDALVQRRTVTTNAFGSFDGTFVLANEPTLGRWQLIVAIGDHRFYHFFDVEAYRKPEFTVEVNFDRTHYTGGNIVPATITAQYFYGQPVVDAPVQFSIAFQSQEGGDVEPPYNGQGVTDSRGQLHLNIQTQRRTGNRLLGVRTSVTDLSRRSQSGSGDVLVTAGLFRLYVETDRSLYHPGERITVQIRAEDYDEKPISTRVKVRLIEMKYDSRHRLYRQTTTRETSTDATGKGIVGLSSPRPGYLTLEVEAFDSEDNKILQTGYVWIVGDEYADFDYPTLSLVADRASYRPGEIATILLNTSLVAPRNTVQALRKKKDAQGYPAAWALVTLEGERLYRHWLVRLDSRTTVLRVPLKAVHFPSVQINVALVQDRHIYEQGLTLTVPLEQHRLLVSVESDKSHYQPGESVTYTVTTRDYRGQPVPAEVSLGIVDAAIYSLRPDNSLDIFSFFYSGQQDRVQTDFSFAAQYSGGAFQTIPEKAESAPSGGTAGEARVRRQFADTAYWNPFVLTDASGKAHVTLTLPDNLTTWRATARGITLETSVGSTTHDMLSSLPLLVRLETPRFYVSGDEAIFSAVVHNYIGVSRSVSVRIETSGAILEGNTTRDLLLPADGQQRMDWKAKIAAGASPISSVRILVAVDGGIGAKDAVEMTLPVIQAGLRHVESRADEIGDTQGVFHQDLTGLPPDATVTLTLSPSLLGTMFQALDYLASYPYGCAEQTMSAFLPDVAVERALRTHAAATHNAARIVRPDLDRWVNLGLQKLYRYQHADGGWNWWEFDETDGDMTAYVLWGLLQAKEAGFLVDEHRIQRGTEALLRLLANEPELSRRADWALTIAFIRPDAVKNALTVLFAKRDHLDVHARASLCMALAALGGRNGGQFQRMIHTVSDELEARVVVRGTTAHWSAEEGGYSWRSDDVEVTARVLRALLTVTPHSTRIPSAVRWLMGNRSGPTWTSTRSSAETVLALAQFLTQTKELKADFQAQVSLDSQPIQTLAVTARNVLDSPLTLTFTPDQWKGRSALTVNKQGVGTLYITSTIRYTTPPEETKPLKQGIAVRRFFRIVAEDPLQAGTVASGTDIDVQVEITADADYRYAILEDALPAGCEVAPTDDQDGRFAYSQEDGGSGFARQEVRDDRVVFFFDSLPKGRTLLSYRLHAETPGTYRVLPGIASLVYFPEIRGSGPLVSMRIEDSKPMRKER